MHAVRKYIACIMNKSSNYLPKVKQDKYLEGLKKANPPCLDSAPGSAHFYIAIHALYFFLFCFVLIVLWAVHLVATRLSNLYCSLGLLEN